MNQKVVVLGASTDETRYSNKAVRKLTQKGYDVIAIGAKPGVIENVMIHTGMVKTSSVYAVTLYLNPEIQKQYYDYIIALKPEFIFYNYGTDNKDLQDLAEKNGIKNRQGCTLVELSLGSF